ncbi:Similar to Mitochondrial import inner membrane translocase subunit tim-21; acc. no. Q7S8S5 [Pyronema omphalodes CBS 100304]|uniref:Mitochondrial import inner membrane translocase subunit Tim21 n=1 Tax=Pyronema omphalodes (strain CBS 100304) TaxID=1076935 RepID=U4LLT4_PYROM|nr:Similar to Mitochondrial import inner membrane translocase subunit tim-21; acc. no. Q7S8S5 [Pyronema omphalodes CBS 100304]
MPPLTGARSLSAAVLSATLRRRLPHACQLRLASTSSTASTASTSSNGSKPQQVTVRGDVSSRRWADLSGGQKIVRSTSVGFNSLTILLGLAVTGSIVTFVYLEVIAPDSVTNWFNRAADRVNSDSRCKALLGDGKIKAYGEETYNRWARNRPIAATANTDKYGVEHLRMRFYVEGDLEKGTVHLHCAKRPGEDEYEYRYLYLDVPGRSRVYLENADDTRQYGESKRGFLGVRWSR